ncbi:hypothetical protein ACFVHW_04515 [Streptomyces sp. NPDC127110]|uniref:hypothetical protein n=1 Tax=Streptomyces sp. NPDC127110 TaxID=3345362 RepID=UPI003632A817
MVTILDTQADARRMAALLAEYDRRLQALERAGQASHTSIEGGAIAVYDKDGAHRGSVGLQPDGTVAVVPANSPPPPTPSPPVVRPVLAGLVVTWDGLWDDKNITPADFACVQVHVGPSEAFAPSATTLAGAVTDVHGGSLTLAVPGYAPVWIRLVGVNTAAGTGPPSSAVQGTPRQAVSQDLIDHIIGELQLADEAVTAAKVAAGAVTSEKIVAGAVQAVALAADAVAAGKIAAGAVTARELRALAVTAVHLAANAVTASAIQAGAIDATHIKAGAITADRLALGTTGNMISDASFEGELTSGRVTAAGAAWAVIADGNGSAKAVQVTATSASPATQNLTLAAVPVLPGESLYLSVDYLASADWAGESLRFTAEWQDAAGTPVGYNSALVRPPVLGSWARISGQQQAPSGAVRARLYLQSYKATAGTVRFDNAEARAVLGTRGAGARAELSPEGLRLYDGSGTESVSLVTGRRNFVTLSSAEGVPVATIDDRGAVNCASLAVAGTVTIGGDRLQDVLTAAPRGIVAISKQVSSVAGGAAEYGYVELAFNAHPARMYRIVLDTQVTASADGGEILVTLRDGGTSTPTISSPAIQSRAVALAGASWRPIHLELVRSGADFGTAGLHRLLCTFRTQGGVSGLTATLFGRPECPGTLTVEDLGPALPDTGLYNSGGGTTTPPKQTVTRTYDAAWSGSYANRSSYNSFYGNQMLQGYFSSTNGTQASLVGFGGTLATDLAGAAISKVEVYLYFDHWYSAGGGTAVIRAHGHSSRPASFSTDSDSVTAAFGRNEGRWVDITTIFDSTSWRGIALDPNNTDSQYYGRARGVGEAYPPQLRVTYTK